MPVNHQNLKLAARLVGSEHAKIIYRLAKTQDSLENKWIGRVGSVHKKIRKSLIEGLRNTGKISIDIDLITELLFESFMETVETAKESVEQEEKVIEKLTAAPKIPKSFRDLRKLYDQYQKTGHVPKRVSDLAEKIKKQYLKKTQSVWRKYSAEFREGDVANQNRVIDQIKKAADTVPARAKNIVRTETTNYYNDARIEIYDQSDAIWGYLFLAIRDQGTTKWCTDKVINGKRGRHGLVYRKGDPLTTKERPSCHWNCRSEMVPLSIHNPRHRKLIEDVSMHRRSHSCHPLPEGWR